MIEWLIKTVPLENGLILALVFFSVLGIVAFMNGIERWLSKYIVRKT